MIDCPNAEIRDLLPDWVHGTLDPALAGRVAAHVADCGACAREAAVIVAARRLLTRGPRVDAARVAAALPRRAMPALAAARPRVAAWRIAAGVALLAAGTGTAVVLRSNSGDRGPTQGADRVPAQVAALTLASDLADLTDVELTALDDAVATLEAAPTGEPAALLTDLEGEVDGGADALDE
ncbi:MAG TPA: zf-HC2 domain-containing protein [Gemmatimonadaceae bacterium]|nr:zf-HC2 domain-containing protein [Gemmatimonadaceae bacterium]